MYPIRKTTICSRCIKKYVPNYKYDEKAPYFINKIFKGIFPGYDTESDEIIKLCNKKNVPINKIVFSQRYFDLRGSRSVGPIYVIEYNNDYYLIDGNHRVIQQIVNGKNEIEALVLDLNWNH